MGDCMGSSFFFLGRRLPISYPKISSLHRCLTKILHAFSETTSADCHPSISHCIDSCYWCSSQNHWGGACGASFKLTYALNLVCCATYSWLNLQAGMRCDLQADCKSCYARHARDATSLSCISRFPFVGPGRLDPSSAYCIPRRGFCDTGFPNGWIRDREHVMRP